MGSAALSSVALVDIGVTGVTGGVGGTKGCLGGVGGIAPCLGNLGIWGRQLFFIAMFNVAEPIGLSQGVIRNVSSVISPTPR